MKSQIHKYQETVPPEKGTQEAREREELILQYAPLVKYIAERMAIRLPPNISKEELMSAGILGLFDAINKFDSDMGIKFQTYAEHRIRGAMLDDLRKMDWISRSIRKDIHRLEDAYASLQSKLGREPRDFEIAQDMGIDLDAYHRIASRASSAGLLSLDEVLPDGSSPKYTITASDGPAPFEELKVKELKKVIADALSSLSEKEQFVVSLYYYEELTLKEIAQILDLTESRISQIHAKAIIKLRVKLRFYHES
jgi:RNA polymerase sigma factor for flagellar operon FliA